jgi:hypothetical protein
VNDANKNKPQRLGISMKQKQFVSLLTGLFMSVVFAQGAISSKAIGFYHPDERSLLTPVFMNSVNSYLRRYEPRLIEKSVDSVKMQVVYDYLYAVELKVVDGEYEVSVTLVENVRRIDKAHELASKLSHGVLRAMERSLTRSTRARERAQRAYDR